MGALNDILAKPYTILLVPDEAGGFVAEVLEFPHCVSEGETPSEAISNVRDAMVGWVESELAMGHDIPEPLGNREFSGRLVLRLPSSLHRKAALLAESDGVSLNQWLVATVAERVGASSGRGGPMKGSDLPKFRQPRTGSEPRVVPAGAKIH